TSLRPLSIIFVGLLREAAARRSRAGLCALFAAAHDIVLTTDLTGRLTFISPAIVPLLGHSREAWLGRRVADLVHPDDAHRLVRLIENPAAGSLLNIRMTAANGTPRWFDVATRRLSTRDGSGEVLITCHAVGKRKQLLDQLGYQARHDVLTGLCNRTAFEEQLEDALAAAAGVAVLFIDLDSFKPVNDTFGHAAGDRVLQVIGGRIRTVLGPDDVAGRFGDDEFGILLRRANEIAARTMAGRVIRAVREPILVDGYEVCVAASIGVSLAVSRPSHSGRLLRAADEAMYKAKQAGPGRYAMADPLAAETTTVEPAVTRPTAVQCTPAETATLEAPAPSAPVLLATDEITPRSPVIRPRSMSFPALPRSPGASGSSPAGRTGHLLSPRRWRTTVREQLGRAIPLLVLGTVILAATAVTLEIEDANRRRDEAQHIAEAHSLVLRLAL
ncbi:diguanylate cyclase domain-containing protein, partial [Frankia sp. CcWB3]